jgi:hypothetical protein
MLQRSGICFLLRPPPFFLVACLSHSWQNRAIPLQSSKRVGLGRLRHAVKVASIQIMRGYILQLSLVGRQVQCCIPPVRASDGLRNGSDAEYRMELHVVLFRRNIAADVDASTPRI